MRSRRDFRLSWNLPLRDRPLVQARVAEAEAILSSARKSGAQAVVTACPLCQFNLDYPQRIGGGAGLVGEGMPVLYFTQMMAAALGLEPDAWGMDGHTVDPRPLFTALQGEVG